MGLENGITTLENSLALPDRVKHASTYSSFTPGYLAERDENLPTKSLAQECLWWLRGGNSFLPF